MGDRHEALRLIELAEGSALRGIADALDRHRNDISALQDDHNALDIATTNDAKVTFGNVQTLHKRIDEEVSFAQDDQAKTNAKIDKFISRTFRQRVSWLLRGR